MSDRRGVRSEATASGARDRRLAFALLAIALPLVSSEARAATYVVRGTDRATLLVPKGVRVEAYENSGYRLTLDGETATVEVSADPLGSAEPFRLASLPPARPGDGAAARLARAVAADAPTRFEAVSRILAWIAANVRYDLDRGAPQDAESVLERRSAYCTGLARLAVALLDALAIPAREVAGYVVGDLPGEGRSGFHRWIEVFYEDRGWVFADPLVSHHFVPASYLRLASSTLESDLPGPALLLSRIDGMREVDLRARTPAARVLARANNEQRYGAVLKIVTDATPPAIARLERGGRERAEGFEAGEALFFGLEPATYQLRIWSAGRIAAERSVDVERPEWMELNVAVGTGPGGGTGETR